MPFNSLSVKGAMVSLNMGTTYLSRAVRSCDVLDEIAQHHLSYKLPCIEQHATNFKVLDLFELVKFIIYSMSMY